MPSFETGISRPPGADPMESGRQRATLQPDAIAALDEVSAGSSRARTLISGLAVYLAELEDSRFVTALHVEAASLVAEDSGGLPADSLADVPGERGGIAGIPAAPPAAIRHHPAATASVRRARWLAIGCVAAIGALAPWHLAHRMIAPQPSPQVVQPGPARSSGPGEAAAIVNLPALPAGVGLNVVIRYPAGDPAAVQGADWIMRRLRAAGYEASDPVAVGPEILQPGIDCFFQQDLAAATVLARLLWGDNVHPRLVAAPADGLPAPGSVRIVLVDGRLQGQRPKAAARPASR